MDVLEEFFPSKHLKAADLNDREIKVTIARVEREKLGEDMRPVIYFNGKEKGVALNKGNTTTLADAFGRNSNDWAGQEITLVSVWTEYQGKAVKGLRIIPSPRRARPDPISSGLPPKTAAMPDDDIPF